jgi:hypothetical protein
MYKDISIAFLGLSPYPTIETDNKGITVPVITIVVKAILD